MLSECTSSLIGQRFRAEPGAAPDDGACRFPRCITAAAPTTGAFGRSAGEGFGSPPESTLNILSLIQGKLGMSVQYCSPSRRYFLIVVALFASAATAGAQPRSTADDVSRATAAAEKLRRANNLPEAIKEFQRAVELAKAAYGPNHWQVAAYSMNLAMAYTDDEQYDKADPIFRNSQAVLLAAWDRGRGVVGQDIVASMFSKYADYSTRVGQLGRAALQFEDALALYSAELTADDDRIAMSHLNLANTLRKIGKLDEALKHAEAALTHRAKYLHPEFTRTKRSLSDYVAYWNAKESLADVLFDLKQYAAAEKIYREIRATYEAAQGKDKHSHSLWQLAKGVLPLGKFEEADELVTRAANISAKTWGEDSDAVAYKVAWQATVKGYRGDWKAAADLVHKALPIQRAQYLRVASGVNESEQLTALQHFTGPVLSDALSLGYARRDDPAVAAKSAEWLMNIKNLHVELHAERALLARDGRFPEVKAVATDLRTVRRELANHLNIGKGPDPAAWVKRRDGLLSREEELSSELARVGGHLRASSAWVELAAVRKAIAAGEVLVEIKRIDVRDFADRGGAAGLTSDPRYVAWVIPATGAGDVAVVDLGPAAEIEGLARKVVARIGDVKTPRAEYNAAWSKLRAEKLTPAEFQKGVLEALKKLGAAEGELEKGFREAAIALSKRVLHPLLAHTGKATRWVISPDADLWLVPWAALVLEDGAYVVDRIALTQVVAGRDLLAATGPKATGAPLVMANPNYSLGITTPETRRSRQTPLVAFEEVAIAVRPYLKAIAGREPEEYIGDRATEEAFKKDRPAPRVVLLGTHGTFAKVDPKEVRPGWAHPDENPLLRCQLTFAGCDRRPRPSDTIDDGMLYGLEILGCDFRGTELVVLAACQSAEGDVHAGQAAVGMRSAFLLAGAREVEATLWSVDVGSTSDLTVELFKRRADARLSADALVEGQRAVRKTMKEECGSAHPFYWAAYTLTVRGR